MKLSSKKGGTIAFALLFAALIFWPQKPDPGIMAGVRCTADAFSVMEHYQLREEAGAQPDAALVAEWRGRWDRLDRQVTSWRRTGRAEPAHLGGLIAKVLAERDARIAKGEEAAWLTQAEARVRECGAG